MGVDAQVVGFPGVSSDVQVGDAVQRQAMQKSQRVVAEVDAVDVDVVDVEQQQAVRLVDHGIDELQLGQRRVGRGVVRDVLDADAPLEEVLGLPDALGDVPNGLVGERNGHQVVEMAMVAAGRQVFGVAADAVVVQKLLDGRQQFEIQRRRTAQGKRQAVADEGIALGKGSEPAPVAAADVDPVLRRDFHEVYRFTRRLALNGEALHEAAAQAQACAEDISRHRRPLPSLSNSGKAR